MKKYLILLIPIVLFACKQKSNNTEPATSFDFDKGNSFLDKNSDSAFYYFNRVTTVNSDSLKTAIARINMAVIQSDAGDFFGAQESLMFSFKLLDEQKKKDYPCLNSIYNELGKTSTNLNHNEQAVKYFKKSLQFTKDDYYRVVISNNIALSYQKLKQYDKALKIYEEISRINTKDQKEYARVLSNIAKTKWLQNPNLDIAPSLLKALKIREIENDKWGMNASYAHLSDFYTNPAPDSALIYATLRYKMAQKLVSPDDQLEALQKLIVLSPNAEIKKYFTAYQRLNDSVQNARNAAKNQFAIIRYDSEKSKADNLKLQKENVEKKYEVATREFFLVVGFIIFISSSIIAVLWYRKRKHKLASEAENTIRESQLKTSKKVHDVVANGLYRVMAEIGNQKEINKDDVLDKIEDLYEKSRDISYDKPALNQKHFNTKISALLTSFATVDTKILIAGNTSTLWENLHDETKYEVEHVLQELMVNMKKHSQATNVVIKFERKNNEIHILYTDNGVGMGEQIKFNNGLRNTGNRIASIHGAIIFDSKVEKGLKIQISFPFS